MVYIGGGEELGRADDGLSRLFMLLRALPSGTQLILRIPLEFSCGGQSPQEEFPWKERRDEFNAIVEARKLRIRREYSSL